MPPLGEKDPSNFDRAVGCATKPAKTRYRSRRSHTCRSIQSDDDTFRMLYFNIKQALLIRHGDHNKLDSLVRRPTKITLTWLLYFTVRRSNVVSLSTPFWMVSFSFYDPFLSASIALYHNDNLDSC